MKTAHREWTCRHCGRRRTAGDADGTMWCEFCAEAFGAKPEALPARPPEDDSRRREVVARLRERYSTARDLIPSEPPPYAQSFGHLEWILGNQRNPDDDGAALGTDVSRLVVLWLEDLVLELDNPALPDLTGSGGGAASSAGRQAAATGLRTASRDFAEAFLSSADVPVAQP